VLGARLSEDSSVRVLLLEAGPDYAATHDVPEDLLDADGFPSSHEWGYQSEPGALGRSIPVPRAKVIGGSTTHNAAAAGRGTPEDYDEWSRLGNPGSVAEPGSTGRPWLHVFPTTFTPGEVSPTGVTFEIAVALLKPRSRGRVTLASRDPEVPPRIEVNLLADPWDVASMVEGIRLACRLARTAPLASLYRGVDSDKRRPPVRGI
jgi:choline dehydrogenase-like flavoprotein